jgi:uncharacterized protein YndB with AHSA1/START domain
MNARKDPIIVSLEVEAPLEAVWQAITNVKEMRQWFFENMPNFKPKVGFTTAFNVQSTTQSFYHMWEVTEVILHKKITYSWQYKEYPEGISFSTFHIEKVSNSSSKLTVICTGLDTFPANVPEFSRKSCLGGWNYFTQRLKAFVEK